MLSNILMNNWFNQRMLMIICITSIAGCAGQEAARKVAALTAESTNELKQETANFFEEADNLAQKNEVRLQLLNQQTLALRMDIGIASTAWEIEKDERATQMFTAMSKVKTSEVGPQSLALTLLQPAPDAPKNSFNPAQYDELVKRLNELAAEPSFTDTVSSYIDFGKAVNDQLNKDSKEAKDGLANTNVNSSTNVTNLLTPK